MYVYNDITTDARVQRAANALADSNELTLISTQKGKQVSSSRYNDVLVGGKHHGLLGILETIWSAIKIIRNQQPDIVYCHDYYSAILAYYLLKTHYSGKIVYDAHELMIPDEKIKDKRQAFFYWFEKKVVNRVGMIICASEQRGRLMKEHYGLSDIPLVIPNISQLQINDDDADTRSLLLSLQSFFSDPKPTVVYAGVVSGDRHIDELLVSAIAMADKCKLLIVGNGYALSSLQTKATEHPELHSTFTGAIPYKCLGSVLSRCDIGFVYYPVDTLNNIYCASNKIYEYASVGLPMLANENPTVKEVLDKTHIGISTSDLTGGLQLLLNDFVAYKASCVRFTQENLWESEVKKLHQAIENLSKR